MCNSLNKRLIVILLLLKFLLQSCNLATKYDYKSTMALSEKWHGKEKKVLAETEIDDPMTQISLTSLSLNPIPAALGAKVFTIAAGHQVSFLVSNNLWQAKVIDPWMGLNAATILPVVCEQSENILPMLQSLARQSVSVYKHRIHLLHMPLGKYIFLGTVGLPGGMQEEARLALYEVVAEKSKPEIIEALIRDGADPNEAAPDGATPLILAIATKQAPIVKLLLEKGADPNKATQDHYTPLLLATDQGEVEIVENLLANGANANQAAHDGSTPLHLAVGKDHLKLVKLLLENGAETDQADHDGYTPLHGAVGKGSLESTIMLLEYNAKPNLANNDGVAPLSVAVDNSDVELVELLLANGAEINQADHNGYTPLHVAARNTSVEIVALLLENGAKPNQAAQDGSTPLHVAASNGHITVMQLLIAYEADITCADQYGNTPLVFAIDENHLQATNYLLHVGADPNTLNQEKASPLHHAVYQDNLGIIKLLLARGAKTNQADADGNMPVHWAAMNRQIKNIKLLLQSDPNLDINAQNNNGDTFSHLIVTNLTIDTEKQFDLLLDVLQKTERNCKSLLKTLGEVSIDIAPELDANHDRESILAIVADYARGSGCNLKNSQGEDIFKILEQNNITKVHSVVAENFFTTANLYEKLAGWYTKANTSHEHDIQEPLPKRARYQ
jgi:ankyrin repeat protein